MLSYKQKAKMGECPQEEEWMKRAIYGQPNKNSKAIVLQRSRRNEQSYSFVYDIRYRFSPQQ